MVAFADDGVGVMVEVLVIASRCATFHKDVIAGIAKRHLGGLLTLDTARLDRH